MNELTGKTATLVAPYMGYSNIEILEKEGVKWSVLICGCGKVIEVFEDEFTLD